MAEKIKVFIGNELRDIQALLQDGLRSGAYLYPFQGILYLISHPSLHGPFFSRLGSTITLGIAVTSTMFFLTYIPQAALLALTSGPLAPLSAILLVLSESSTIVNFLSRTFLLQDSLIDTFDGTLLTCGHTDLVAKNRQVKAARSGEDPISRLGRVASRPLSELSIASLLRPLVYWPLNLIPVVGSLMYIVGQGKKVGPMCHSRYFQLKGWNSRQRDEWVTRHRAAYMSFGAAAFVLEMVPFASLAFAYTNTVGAALWASSLEESSRQEAGKSE
ncbi:hypothetical protein VTO42DRAFT_987 [Malbranchea cinnamomea]